MAETCYGYYAECPAGDRDCILERGHAGSLHINRAGFAWDDEESADSARRVFDGESGPERKRTR